MMRLIDRYLLKEILSPFLLGLGILTFLMLLYQLLRLTEWIVGKGVSLLAVADLFLKLLPSFFLVTIPMATAFAVLIAFNRLSFDKEYLALYACGVSFVRILWPVFVFSILAASATLGMGALSSPWDGTSIKSAALRILKEKIGVGLEAGQFNEILPGVMIYTASAPSPSEMQYVFIYDGQSASHPRIIAAHKGTIINNAKGEGQGIRLFDGMLRADHRDGDYQMTFASYSLRIPTISVLSEGTPKTLQRRLVAFHKNYALTVATVLFAFMGIPLGLLSGRVGRLGIVLGMILILFYYALTLAGDSLALSHRASPGLAAWLPNLVLLPITLLLLGGYAKAPRLYSLTNP